MDNPLGIGGESLHEWFFPTKTFQTMHGGGVPGGTAGLDDDFAARGFENIGAWIIGRNMFGPMRGPWEDHAWQGWWGDNPPYQAPVYILTHHARPSIEMAGGTVFHFVSEGIEVALAKAKEGAGAKDVRLGGGVSTIRQFLKAKLLDEMHIAVSPVLFGSGENLWRDIHLPQLGYECVDYSPSEKAAHMVFRRRSGWT
jgi:dihydrofolate reductase